MRGTPLLSRPPWSYAPSKHAYPAALRVAAPRAPARAPARPHTTASAPATARLDAVRAARNHTDTHPESSRAPARLGAVRAALHHPSLENAASLDAAVDALAHELVRSRPAPDAPVYRELHAMFFACIRRLVRDGDAQRAGELLDVLVRLAPHTPLCARHRALLLRVLGEPCAFAPAWRAVRRWMPDAAPHETTQAVRALLRVNAVGEASRVVQWHVRRFRRLGTPPPSFALLHNVMVQMRFVGTHLDAAPAEVQASYTDALVRLGTLLREHQLPLPGAREDMAWLIKLLYTYDLAPLAHRPHPRTLRVLRTSLPMYVDRLPAAHDTRTPPLSSATYNALVQYTLHYAHNPLWCRRVLEHMTHIRTPPLPPSPALVTILLRQATRRRLGALGLYALELDAPPAAPPHTPRLLVHVERAVAIGDTHRLIALLQFITALHLRSARHTHGVRAASVAQRVLPMLHRRRAAQAPRGADVSAAVFTLAARAGKLGLALRIWRWMKQQSVHAPISVHTGTVLMQLLADAVRKPHARLPRWATRRGARRRRAPDEVRVLALEEYAFLVQHWCATAHAPPDVRFYRPLLRIVRRTAHTPDAALARIWADMAVLGHVPPRHTPAE